MLEHGLLPGVVQVGASLGLILGLEEVADGAGRRRKDRWKRSANVAAGGAARPAELTETLVRVGST